MIAFKSKFIELRHAFRAPRRRSERPPGSRRAPWFATRRNRRGRTFVVVVGHYTISNAAGWSRPLDLRLGIPRSVIL